MKKICTKCGKPKEFKEFVKNKNCKDGREGQCKTCRAKRQKVYRSENKEKLTKRKKVYCANNKDKLAKREKTYCTNLIDHYVIKKIVEQYSISSQDITPEMIEAKRQIILTHRKMKEARDEFNSARN